MTEPAPRSGMTCAVRGYPEAAVETVYSLSHDRPGGAVVLDFMIGRAAAGWYRHEFDRDGHYIGVGPADVEAVCRELGVAAPATFVVELRAAACALESAVGALLEAAESAAMEGELDMADELAARAGEVERERLRTLDEVVAACDAAWDEAVEDVERARGIDPRTVPEAIRTVELLWTARQAVRRMLRGS